MLTGPAVAGTTQASEAGAANQNQSLLQAAALAAKVYEKSFVHLPTNQYIWLVKFHLSLFYLYLSFF